MFLIGKHCLDYTSNLAFVNSSNKEWGGLKMNEARLCV